MKIDGLTIVFLLALAAAALRWITGRKTGPTEPPPNVVDGQAAAGSKKEATIAKGRATLEKIRRVIPVNDRWLDIIKRATGRNKTGGE